ncbi:MAG: MauE/DoxX family redox-associated membrane protein [Candidatus Acidiferrales bacterium]
MPLLPQSDRNLAYFLLRFTLGISIFIHGAVRLPKIQEFAAQLVTQFANTPLPAFLVRPFAMGLTVEEVVTGFLLMIGLWTRWALIIGALTMAALVFGTALRSDWPTVAIQLLYAAIYAVLLAMREYNGLAVDALKL